MNIAILVAMEEELAPFLATATTRHPAAPERGSQDLAGARFLEIEINNIRVLLVTTGIGLVNAAIAATLAITRFSADTLISCGSAGGVGKGVRVGDVVVATETCYSSADATAFTNYALGQIPQMPARFVADANLVRDSALLNAGALTPQNDGGGGPAKSAVHRGLTLSSDAFIWEKNYADYVGKFPDALATDMETAAIGQVAYKFGVPWVSIRAISDLCGPQGPDDFKTHIDGAAEIAAQAVTQLLSKL